MPFRSLRKLTNTKQTGDSPAAKQVRRFILGAGAVAGLIAIAGIWLVFTSGPPEPTQPPAQTNTDNSDNRLLPIQEDPGYPIPSDITAGPGLTPAQPEIETATAPVTPTEEFVFPELTPEETAPITSTPARTSIKPPLPPEVQSALKQWAETKPKIQQAVAKYQYKQALALGTEFQAKTLPPLDSFISSAATDIAQLKREVNAYTGDAKGVYDIFRQMADAANPQPNRQGEIARKKLDLDTIQIWVTRSDEDGIEGEIAGVSGSRYSRKWSDMPAKIIYDLLPETITGKAVVYKAIFCYTHNLATDGEQILVNYYQRNTQEKRWIDEVLARYDPELGGRIPPGGFVIYQRQWVTPEAKYYLEKGYVKFSNKWVTYDQAMQLRGFVKFQDRWVTPNEKARLDGQLAALESLRGRLAPKGIINKPGADSENIAWAQARVKETPHYRIKTNLSEFALNDIGYVMECLCYEFRKIFKVSRDMPNKLDVWVFKNQKEYFANGGKTGSAGVFMTSKISNSSSGMIMAYYLTNEAFNTTTVLLHEGTHQFIMLYTGAFPPIWINEGLAAYYESSKFEGTSLKTNLVNKARLVDIQNALRAGNHIRLRDFINTPQSRYQGGLYYAEGWSLTFFLFNWHSGFYADELETYFNFFKRPENINGLSSQQHTDIFERTFKVKIDVLEEQWKDYTIRLN